MLLQLVQTGSRARDLQASANLLCVRADCCKLQFTSKFGKGVQWGKALHNPSTVCCHQGAAGWLGTQAGLGPSWWSQCSWETHVTVMPSVLQGEQGSIGR